MDPSSNREMAQEVNDDHLSVLEEKSSENKQVDSEDTGDVLTEKIDLSIINSEVTEGAFDRADENFPAVKDEDVVKEQCFHANEDDISEGGSPNVDRQNGLTIENSDDNGIPSDDENSIFTTPAVNAIQGINPEGELIQEGSRNINDVGETEDSAGNHAEPASLGNGVTEADVREDEEIDHKPASLGNGVTEADIREDEEIHKPASLGNGVTEADIREDEEIHKPASLGNGVTEADIREDKKDLSHASSGKEVTESDMEEKKDEHLKPSSVEDVVAKAEIKEEEQEWQDILGNGLLKRRVLMQGKGKTTRPEKGQIVMLRTAGRMEDGTAVDWNHGIEFIQGDMEVIPALDLVVALMELEEVCEVVTDSKYAYGQYGKQDNVPPIPPNAHLTYELELLAVRDGPNIHTMKDEERIELGNKKRELGNDLYTRKDYSGAINCYQQALKFLGNSETPEVQEAKIKCWNNLAAAQLKIKAYQAAHSSCMEVLQIDKDNVKALFRRGKVLAAQGELVEALMHTKKASQLEPGNKTIRSELLQMRRLRAAQQQEERNLYQRMVAGLGKEQRSKSNGNSLLSWPFLLGATAIAVGGILTALYMIRH